MSTTAKNTSTTKGFNRIASAVDMPKGYADDQ
jgi:hypothetical protein